MPTRTRSPLRIFAYICLSVLFWYEKAYAAEQFVIIEVQPENSLVVLGKKYSVGDLIVIPNDTVVTLLGEDGSVTKVTGPATIKVTKDAIDRKSSDNSTAQITVGALSKISEFLLRSRPDEIVFGGTRTVQKGLSDPWVISIDGNGSGCFRDSAIGLRRLDARNRVTIALQFKEQPGEYLHTLAQQEFVVYLPPGLSEGRIIKSLNLVGSNKSIILSKLPKAIDSSDKLLVLEWMIGMDCFNQARNLIVQLATKAQGFD